MFLDKFETKLFSAVILIDNVDTDKYKVPISLDKEFKDVFEYVILDLWMQLSGIIKLLKSQVLIEAFDVCREDIFVVPAISIPLTAIIWVVPEFRKV